MNPSTTPVRRALVALALCMVCAGGALFTQLAAKRLHRTSSSANPAVFSGAPAFAPDDSGPVPFTPRLAASPSPDSSAKPPSAPHAELTALARRFPEEALQRVREIVDRHDQRHAANLICLVVADQDPSLALRSAWSLGLGRLAEDTRENAVIEALMERWVRADSDAAFSWAATLPTDEDGRRDLVLRGLAQALAPEAPALAASVVLDHISSDTGAQFEAMHVILRRSATRGREDALRWIACFPEGPLRDRGIDFLATLPADPSTSAEG